MTNISRVLSNIGIDKRSNVLGVLGCKLKVVLDTLLADSTRDPTVGRNY